MPEPSVSVDYDTIMTVCWRLDDRRAAVMQVRLKMDFAAQIG